MRQVIAYDSTLRDGAQAQGVSFTVEDKLKIVQRLDDLGIGYIEAGNPGSNPKDLAFFEQVTHLQLKSAKIIAFGSTRKVGATAAEDRNLQSLLLAFCRHSPPPSPRTSTSHPVGFRSPRRFRSRRHLPVVSTTLPAAKRHFEITSTRSVDPAMAQALTDAVAVAPSPLTGEGRGEGDL